MLKFLKKLKAWANTADDKFIDELSCTGYSVLTPSGYEPFKGIGKTIKYQEYRVVLQSGKDIICADTHIFIDGFGNEIFCNELIPGKTILKTIDGSDAVKSVTKLKTSSNMYDLLDVEGSLYYTNDILSHNSTSFEIYITWYILFHVDKNIAILANKASQAKEILGRIKSAYTNLPKWLQQGVVKWNESGIKLENGCRVSANATSTDAIRGQSIQLLIIDECINKDSKLTIRHKHTHEIKEISIGELYDNL